MPLMISWAHHRSMNTTVTVQAELEAELAKKKARAARFSLPVKTTAEEVCSAMLAPACSTCCTKCCWVARQSNAHRGLAASF